LIEVGMLKQRLADPACGSQFSGLSKKEPVGFPATRFAPFHTGRDAFVMALEHHDDPATSQSL